MTVYLFYLYSTLIFAKTYCPPEHMRRFRMPPHFLTSPFLSSSCSSPPLGPIPPSPPLTSHPLQSLVFPPLPSPPHIFLYLPSPPFFVAVQGYHPLKFGGTYLGFTVVLDTFKNTQCTSYHALLDLY